MEFNLRVSVLSLCADGYTVEFYLIQCILLLGTVNMLRIIIIIVVVVVVVIIIIIIIIMV